jgi:hypothetical protein
MPRITRLFAHPVALAAGLLLLAAAAAHAESRIAEPGQAARASLDFRIVIPPVVRLLDNQHPAQLRRDESGRLSGRQTLVLLSNLKRGACVTLRRPSSPAAEAASHWRPQALDDGIATLQPAGDGWRLCTLGPGRHTLRVQHEFEPAAAQAVADPSVEPTWPVITELTTI